MLPARSPSHASRGEAGESEDDLHSAHGLSFTFSRMLAGNLRCHGRWLRSKPSSRVSHSPVSITVAIHPNMQMVVEYGSVRVTMSPGWRSFLTIPSPHV